MVGLVPPWKAPGDLPMICVQFGAPCDFDVSSMYWPVESIQQETTCGLHLIDALCVWIFDRYELVHHSRF